MENFACLLRNIRVMKNSKLNEVSLQRLKDNKSYQLALKMVDKKQSKAISTMIEGWLSGIVSVLEPIVEKLDADPELKKQVFDTTNGHDNKSDD